MVEDSRWIVLSYVNMYDFDNIAYIFYFNIGEEFVDSASLKVFTIYYNIPEDVEGSNTIFPKEKLFKGMKFNAIVDSQLFLFPNDMFEYELEKPLIWKFDTEEEIDLFNKNAIKMMSEMNYSWLNKIVNDCLDSPHRHLGLYRRDIQTQDIGIADILSSIKELKFGAMNLSNEYNSIVAKFYRLAKSYETKQSCSILDVIYSNIKFRPLIFIQEYHQIGSIY